MTVFGLMANGSKSVKVGHLVHLIVASNLCQDLDTR